MNIITVGIEESGGLWLFNCARLICEKHGTVYGNRQKYFTKCIGRDYDFTINSCSLFDRNLIRDSVVLSIIQKPENLIPSQKDVSLIDIYYNIAMFNAYANVVIDFDLIKEDEIYAIQKVSFGLDLSCNPEEIKEELEKIKGPDKGISNLTLLTKKQVL